MSLPVECCRDPQGFISLPPSGTSSTSSVPLDVFSSSTAVPASSFQLTRTPFPASTTQTTATTTTTPGASGTDFPLTAAASSGSSSKVGPIVGGVVGGVGGAAILGGILAWLYIRHRRNQRGAAGTTLGSNTAYTPPNEHMAGGEPQMYQAQTQPGYASVPPHSPPPSF